PVAGSPNHAVIELANPVASGYTDIHFSATNSDTSPNNWLVGPNIDIDNAFQIKNGATLSNGNPAGGSTLMTILSSGRVGIGTISPGAGLDVYSTGAMSAMIVPRDSTANRPGTAVNGMIRYNTTTNSLEEYANSNWAALATGGSLANYFQQGGNNFGQDATL